MPANNREKLSLNPEQLLPDGVASQVAVRGLNRWSRNERGGIAWKVAVGAGLAAAGAVAITSLVGAIEGSAPSVTHETDVVQQQPTIVKFVDLNKQEYAGAYVETGTTTTDRTRFNGGKWLPSFNVPWDYSQETANQLLELEIGQKESIANKNEAESNPGKYTRVKVTYNPNTNKAVVDIPADALTFDIIDHPERDTIGSVSNGLTRKALNAIRYIDGGFFPAVPAFTGHDYDVLTKISMEDNYAAVKNCAPTAWTNFAKKRFRQANIAQIEQEVQTFAKKKIEPSDITINLPYSIGDSDNIYADFVARLSADKNLKLSNVNSGCKLSPAAARQAAKTRGRN